MIRGSRRRERLSRGLIGLALVGLVLAVNLPTVTSFAEKTIHDIEINSQGYKESKGHWSILTVPSKYRIHAVHAAMLYTGKVLIIAGSGNNLGYFKAGTFKSIIWDPQTDKFKVIHTPSDMFCGGHAFLPDGRLLIAGGTTRYEMLAKELTRAAGVMRIQSRVPGGKPVKLPAGTVFTSPAGVAFRSIATATVAPAGQAVAPGEDEVWVEAVEKGRGSVIRGEHELHGCGRQRQ